MNSEWQSLPPQTQQELKNTMNAMQPPQSVEEVKATLETTEKGGVRQSIRNCLTVFQRDPVLAGAIAYNILTDRKDIIKPIGFHRESTALTDTDMKYLLLYLEETYGLTSEKKIETAIGIVANMLNQANGDRQILAKQLNISPHQLSYVTHSGEGEGLLFFGNVILPFVDHFPKDLELYRILTTRLSEVAEAQKHE